MVPITRRAALRGATALLAGAAGCSDFEAGESTATAGRERDLENVATDPPHRTLRATTDASIVWVDDGESGTNGTPRRYLSDRFIVDEASADRLRFAESVDSAPVREFIAATEFETETVYVDLSSVGECYRLELCYVGWSDAEIETRYGRTLRDADVSCGADVRASVATFVRIPAAIDPERISSYGSGMSSGGCRLPPWIREPTAGDGSSATTGEEE
ncbi:hypothetical protein [Halorarum halobium]|uniref:hypothetical protein n=1 Tax=Halorarum halobium TaxID=3075121 RepID=UPI0028AB470B|nr:hypothetical protein [Halobaculum sp. XH14]